MYMIFFVLHDPNQLDNVLYAWEEVGVKGITIIPSIGVGRLRQSILLREDFPLIPSLQDMCGHDEVMNRTLITIVKDEKMISAVVEATQRIIGNLNEPNTGILTVLPVIQAYGLDRKDED
jgi:nitrogen regulatory protein PII